MTAVLRPDARSVPSSVGMFLFLLIFFSSKESLLKLRSVWPLPEFRDSKLLYAASFFVITTTDARRLEKSRALSPVNQF